MIGSYFLTSAWLSLMNPALSRMVVPMLYSAPPLAPLLDRIDVLRSNTVVDPRSVKIAPPCPPVSSPSSGAMNRFRHARKQQPGGGSTSGTASGTSRCDTL